MAKHFLYLTNDKLIALIWKSGLIVERETFAVTDAESPQFAAYVDRHKTIPTYVVTDLIEEDFRVDAIPHLRGNDRDAVLERKLGQLYRATTFRHAIVQGREEDGRRDDRVLYHAVTNADLLRPWLAVLEAHSVPVEGIYSSAVLSVLLPAALGVFLAHTMLVTVVPDFGLRQTYFRNKQIRFSRLTPIIHDERQTAGDLIAAEISRTWQYLDSLRNFSADDTLEVCILAHARDREIIAQAILAYPLLHYRFLDIEEVAEKIKLRSRPTSSHAEDILVHLFAQGRIENHFAGKEQTRFAQFRRARIGLLAAIAGILVAGVCATAFNLYEASLVSAEIDKRNTISSRLQSEYQAISTEMRQQPSASALVKDAALFYLHQIKPGALTPAGFLREIADLVAEFPKVSVLQIVWSTAQDANMIPTYMPLPTAAAAGIRSESRTSAQQGAPAQPAAQNAGPANDANPALAGNKFQVLIIEAAISPFDGRFRDALVEIDRFVDRLNQMPTVKATLVATPLDTSTDSAILASGAEQKTVAEARFAVKVVRSMEGR